MARGFVEQLAELRRRKPRSSATRKRVAADPPGAIPPEVERYAKQVRRQNPHYDEAQVWAVAWSIYCKHKAPGSAHCHLPTAEYFAGKNRKR